MRRARAPQRGKQPNCTRQKFRFSHLHNGHFQLMPQKSPDQSVVFSGFTVDRITV
jgi:hypothetical protein